MDAFRDFTAFKQQQLQSSHGRASMYSIIRRSQLLKQAQDISLSTDTSRARKKFSGAV
eukprot:CAMPEP_0184502004 /NCGR_PEP_ID=MMETSP0113_2-20130426/49153_1 /TAXON_ID=91329 /ORGANISM="Norrisiella sphaerica, Strain BC52" /LENGTH=57 /DNA_ID=CAMNT_0026890969 /DNA_START=71 /DNA_END=241 /DNA_ORIENTATION=+